jgi:hypothetical protein
MEVLSFNMDGEVKMFKFYVTRLAIVSLRAKYSGVYFVPMPRQLHIAPGHPHYLGLTIKLRQVIFGRPPLHYRSVRHRYL